MAFSFAEVKHDLLPDDFRSATWRRLTKTLETELERLRESNDYVHNDAVMTASIRGQIEVIKEILALGRQPSASDRARPASPVEHTVTLQELGIDPPY